MREIKFRAWDESRKQMIYQFGTLAEDKPQLMTDNDDRLICGHYMPNEDWCEPALMQYTGLKDVNGKEIYEGDVVNYWLSHDSGGITVTSQVEWFKYAFRLNRLWLLTEIRAIEVIGNIYENPELIA